MAKLILKMNNKQRREWLYLLKIFQTMRLPLSKNCLVEQICESSLPNVDSNKQKSLIQEARIALDAIQRGEPIEAIGKPIPRTGKQAGDLTEIDVETENEIIQVKGGDYSNKNKLDDEDLRQMTETKRYRDRRANPQWRYFDSEGNELPTRAKKVVFHFTNPPVDPRLIQWLTDKDVEPRVGL